ncbi:hypothetical protein FQN50_008417 [Emmonsiellopsis sp. PD_5]|nr:hypothetical protein FQN50_008417 [Emmonsiellopsis sp. PD_5]
MSPSSSSPLITFPSIFLSRSRFGSIIPLSAAASTRTPTKTKGRLSDTNLHSSNRRSGGPVHFNGPPLNAFVPYVRIPARCSSGNMGSTPGNPAPQRFLCVHDIQTHCSHSTVTRVYNTDGNLRCDICHQNPDLGWVFGCTEDKERLEAEKRMRCPITPSEDTVENGGDLSPWIIKAIEDGQYTPEQVELIKAQRANVLRTIKVANSIAPEQGPSDQSSSNERPPNSGGDIDGSFVTMISGGLLPACYSTLGSFPVSICQLRVCPKCQRTAHERASVSLDQVCKDTYMTDNDFSKELEAVEARFNEVRLSRNILKLKYSSSSKDITDAPVASGGLSPSDVPMSTYGQNGTSAPENGGMDPITMDIKPVRRNFKDAIRRFRSLNDRRGNSMPSIDSPVDGDMADRATSENTPPGAKRPALTRRSKYNFTIQHHQTESSADGDLGVPAMDKQLESGHNTPLGNVRSYSLRERRPN